MNCVGLFNKNMLHTLCVQVTFTRIECVEGAGLAKQADLAGFAYLTKTCYIICVKMTFTRD